MDTAELVLEREEAAPPKGRGMEWQFAFARALVFAVLAKFALDGLGGVSVTHEPTGTGWLTPLAPAASVFAAVLLVSAVAAMWGKLWPYSGWVATATGFVVLALPQMDGKVDHYHHVWWFAVLLVIGERGPWLRASWLLLSWVYFIPGLSKLAHFDQLADGGMAHTLERVRDQRGWHTPIPSGAWFPVATTIGTIVIEMAMVGLVFTRWRKLAVPAGLAFHLGVRYVLGINFWMLFFFYPVFLMSPEGERDETRAPWLWAGVCILGSLVLGQHAWPFAIYPTFSNGL